MNKCTERLYNGMIKENPTFVQMLGMCPTLAVTTSAINGIGMGLTTTVILVMSNMMISLLRKLIPDRVRIPAFIIVIASFVTIVQFLLEGFIPSLYDSLGIFIPLIVVNCIILGRAESYASKNPVLPSVFDGLGMGLGFTIGLTAIGAFRELFGAGTIFGFQIMPGIYQPITIFILAPGAFFVLAFLIAAQNKVKLNKAKEAGVVYDVCKDADCSHCANAMCGGRFFAFSSTVEGEDANEDGDTTKTEAAKKEDAEMQTAKATEPITEETPSEDAGEEAAGGSEISEPESAALGKESKAEEAAFEASENAEGDEAEGEKEAGNVEAKEEISAGIEADEIEEPENTETEADKDAESEHAETEMEEEFSGGDKQIGGVTIVLETLGAVEASEDGKEA